MKEKVELSMYFSSQLGFQRVYNFTFSLERSQR